MNPLDRYEPLVDDPAAFRAACGRALPTTVRANAIKSSVERTRRALDEEGIAHDPVPWADDLLTLPDSSPGDSWAFAHGWLHGQEEVSALPARALDPRPGERVWCACAAPGSKATHAAALMDDRGNVVANDNSLGRLSALRHNAQRLGVTATTVTRQDARSYSLAPFAFEAFDRALVDVPCSCEGTVRKNPDVVDEWTMDHVESLAEIQTDILRRAVQATRAGGTVVYSTCTFAPEENEAVLDRVLAAEDCRVVEWDAPAGLATDPGVTEWAGETYDPQVERATRVYPHRNDTGGFFCAKVAVGG
ncbi:MAG: RsmB/NOP family class I SAM-dependent RNA methyltransferase [Haloferacaceae archaeon]